MASVGSSAAMTSLGDATGAKLLAMGVSRVPVVVDDAVRARVAALRAAVRAVDAEFGVAAAAEDDEAHTLAVFGMAAPGAAPPPLPRGMLGEGEGGAPPRHLTPAQKVERYVRGLAAVDDPGFPLGNSIYNRIMRAAYKHLSRAENERFVKVMRERRIGMHSR